MYSSGLDKTDEYEADRLGVVYAARAGYDPYGLPRVLSAYAANAGGEGYELLFSTHPKPQDRLAELGKVMGNKFVAYETTGLADSSSFQQIVQLAVSYPDPAKPKAGPGEKAKK
jgi:predicted Zn-dependent protease